MFIRQLHPWVSQIYLRRRQQSIITHYQVIVLTKREDLRYQLDFSYPKLPHQQWMKKVSNISNYKISTLIQSSIGEFQQVISLRQLRFCQPLTQDDCQLERLGDNLYDEPVCLLCRQGYIVYNKKCVKKCPPGTYYSLEPMSQELKAKNISNQKQVNQNAHHLTLQPILPSVPQGSQ
ncbi:hypothetical protein FGO68_gene15727 [Halteria grandinella]|uniref:Uncharacterized protein n=1 Tax=Halteria grandinella TaxID=5974 RepID=A0A8J8P8P3_HALGN|nr:hypothetical protein FGO68_gene15727 [Halteria grandinella]